MKQDDEEGRDVQFEDLIYAHGKLTDAIARALQAGADVPPSLIVVTVGEKPGDAPKTISIVPRELTRLAIEVGLDQKIVHEWADTVLTRCADKIVAFVARAVTFDVTEEDWAHERDTPPDDFVEKHAGQGEECIVIELFYRGGTYMNRLPIVEDEHGKQTLSVSELTADMKLNYVSHDRPHGATLQ